ncbi:MAG TPA: VOC family protein [Rhizomicrobium sp.]|jgi:PhnB protein|nr:VOC family protein [Rhizomicrobium sp.]
MAGPSPAPGTLTPYIIVKDASAAIAFYEKVFGAKEDYRLPGPDGHIGHAELAIGAGRLMLADEHPAFGALSPPSIGGTPVKLHLYVEDVDATIACAEKEGATVLRPAQDQFYGDRSGMIADPFGHQWFLGTRKEDVTPEEMRQRYKDSFATE